MSASTIQDLMFFMCAVKFDLEEEQLAFTRELTTRDEIELSQLVIQRKRTLHLTLCSLHNSRIGEERGK